MPAVSMKKILRYIFLSFPNFYDFLYHIKNSFLLSFYLKKVHEDDFNGFKLLSEKRPQLFLDIGANAGMSALSIFLVKPNAKVISFEPNPIHYSYLDKIGAKFRNFKYYQFGLGNEEKTLNFYYPIYNGRKMTALGSFEYDEAKNWLNSKRVYFFDESKLEIERIQANVKLLDSLNLDPEFIKMDVEGFEYQVLLGAKKTIARARPIFLIEGVNENSDVHIFFKRIDYCVYGYSNGRFALNDFSEINNFLIPREKLYLIKDSVVDKRDFVAVWNKSRLDLRNNIYNTKMFLASLYC